MLSDWHRFDGLTELSDETRYPSTKTKLHVPTENYLPADFFHFLVIKDVEVHLPAEVKLYQETKIATPEAINEELGIVRQTIFFGSLNTGVTITYYYNGQSQHVFSQLWKRKIRF